MVAFTYLCNAFNRADYLIQSTPRPHLFALPWVEGKLVFARVYKGFLETAGIPGLVATGSWEPFLWLHFRLRKSKDLQGFSIVPRADPTRGQVRLETPTGHPRDPTLRNHTFSQRF